MTTTVDHSGSLTDLLLVAAAITTTNNNNNTNNSFLEAKSPAADGTPSSPASEPIAAPAKESSLIDEIEPPLAYRELAGSPPPGANATREYLDQLFWDKNELRQSPAAFRHVTRLIDSEISRVVDEISTSIAATTTLSSTATAVSAEDGAAAAGAATPAATLPRLFGGFPDLGGSGSGTGSGDSASAASSKVVLQEKIFVPVDKYPRYNFVGRILGPRGMTAKQLEEETGCKIMVRGRGSCRTEPLHVLIHAEDHADKVELKLKKAVERITQLLTPPPEGKDELKRKQLIELSIINGTYRPTTATKLALQAPRMASSFSGGAGSPSSGPLAGLDPAIFAMLGDPAKRRSTMSLFGNTSFDYSAASSPHSPPPPSSPRHNAGAPCSVLDDNQAYLASLLAASNANAFSGNSFVSDYYRQLVAMSLADPALLSYGVPPQDLLAAALSGAAAAGASLVPQPPAAYGGNERPGSPHHGGAMGIGAGTGGAGGQGGQGAAGLIPQANMQQYLAAAAMLGGMPFLNDHRDSSSASIAAAAPAAAAAAAAAAPAPVLRQPPFRNQIHHPRSPLFHDGSGDAQMASLQAVSVAPPTNPMGGAVKRA